MTVVGRHDHNQPPRCTHTPLPSTHPPPIATPLDTPLSFSLLVYLSLHGIFNDTQTSLEVMFVHPLTIAYQIVRLRKKSIWGKRNHSSNLEGEEGPPLQLMQLY